MLNLSENQNQTFSTKTKPAIHISALPTRQNQQMDLPSFSIPLQYNLGTFKKIDEVQLEIENPEINNHWDGRAMNNFNLMNLKPLNESRENIDINDLKYEVKNEINRVNLNDIANQAIAEDILGKEVANEGQTISPDFEIQRYDTYHENSETRFREGFNENIIEDTRNEFVCDGEFLCKSNYGKIEEKRGDFDDCHLLDSDNNAGISNFEENM